MTIPMDSTFVAAERLGWPPPPAGSRRSAFWETQRQMVFDDSPDEPTATAHLQTDSEVDALCGYPWELLMRVPGEPEWTDLHPHERCSGCSRAVGRRDEDPTDRAYRFAWFRTTGPGG